MCNTEMYGNNQLLCTYENFQIFHVGKIIKESQEGLSGIFVTVEHRRRLSDKRNTFTLSSKMQ